MRAARRLSAGFLLTLSVTFLSCKDEIVVVVPVAVVDVQGPGTVQVNRAPESIAGHSWDGGPRGERPLLL